MSNTWRECRQAILEQAGALNLPPSLQGEDPARILAAIAHNESYYGKYNQPRVEPGYSPGGYYFRRAAHVRDEFDQWGAMAAASHGSFQILHIVAWELGYRGRPAALQDDALGIGFAIRLINRRIVVRGAQTLVEIADAYNSGCFKDANVPHRYIQKFLAALNSAETDRFLAGDERGLFAR